MCTHNCDLCVAIKYLSPSADSIQVFFRWLEPGDLSAAAGLAFVVWEKAECFIWRRRSSNDEFGRQMAKKL